MRTASATEVRALIARLVLGERQQDETLGEVSLRAHQRTGVERIQRLLDEHQGALLADDVGLGKTFVALAVAGVWGDTVVIAPAALRDTWRDAARRASVVIRFVSVESLGRRGAPPANPALVIVDEAHHLRSPKTRRFAAATSLCRAAKVLLLSATPIQNRLADLRTILSLFLGERAHGMTVDDLGRFIVRRLDSDLAPGAGFALPVVRPPRWVHAASDTDCLEAILALPEPLPPADGGYGGALLTYSLVRQWASSRAALRAALRRRVSRAHAMRDALNTGRFPTHAELAAWSGAAGAQQLAFPEIMVYGETPDAEALLAQLEQHQEALRAFDAMLANAADPDVARADALRRILDDHPGERVIAFSAYAETVAVLFRYLSSRARVAQLTHGGGRVAGGPITRRDVLRRFSAGGSSRAAASDRIDLLLTTDVLSEGIDLQDASVVVHLDLAWNPARLAQRVGRLRRPGAARETITVYLFAPPGPAERVLQIERRLREKLAVAARAVGVAGAILPDLVPSFPVNSGVAHAERLTDILIGWRAEGGSEVTAPVCATVQSSRDAAIACARNAHGVVLLAIQNGACTDDRAVLADLLPLAGGESRTTSDAGIVSLAACVQRWMRERGTATIIDLPSLHVARARRSVLHRVEAIARHTARHHQPRLAPLMRAARQAATATLSAGAERVLQELASARLNDDAWLHAVGEFSSLHARGAGTPDELLALLVLRPDA